MSISERRKIADRAVHRARAELSKALADVQNVIDDCDHADAVLGSHGGENCRHCSECGGHDV